MKKNRWLNWTEYALLLGSGAGTMASVATQQAFFAAAPLSVLVALGLVNRQRLQRELDQSQAAMLSIDDRVADRLQDVRSQLSLLPTPEQLSGLHRSMMDQSRRDILSLSQVIEHTRSNLEQQIQEQEIPELQTIRDEMAKVQANYKRLCTALENVNARCHQLSDVSRLESTEGIVAKLRTEVMQLRTSLDVLGSNTKNNSAGLHDQLHYLTQQVQEIATQDSQSLLREEVQELIKLVVEMVPRDEFLELSSHVKELQAHPPLSPELTLPTDLSELAISDAVVIAPTNFEEAARAFDNTLVQMTEGLQSLEKALTVTDETSYSLTPTVEATIHQAVVTYLSSFRLQLGKLSNLTRNLETQQQTLQHLLPQDSNAVALTARIDQLQNHLAVTDQQLGSVTEAVLAAVAETLENHELVSVAEPTLMALTTRIDHLQNHLTATDQQLGSVTDAVLEAVHETLQHQRLMPAPVPGDLLLDFPADTQSQSNSRQALEQMLSQAQDRIVLVWPWADGVELDEGLLQQFQHLLARNCRLDIGWCHLGDDRDQRLLHSISQRWSTDSIQHQQLKQALNQLLPLKQRYPNLFSFKVLGTTENFVVDVNKTGGGSALIGMQALATQTSLFPKIHLKLRTTDPGVVRRLVQRFDDAIIEAEDAGAYFNRGTTRYDMRDYGGAIDDFSQVLHIRPTATAYNCRGVAWVDQGDYAKALQDFGQAIRLDAHLFAARCNRGALRLKVKDYVGALNDLEVASDLRPQSALPSFYQGQALQALGNSPQAAAKFGLAIELEPDSALAYCYRGAVYQKQGYLVQAVADLEKAAQLLRSLGDETNLCQVMRKLETLKQGPQVRMAVAV